MAPNVSRLTASDLTGNILIEHEAATPLHSILEYLRARIQREITAPGAVSSDTGPVWHTLTRDQTFAALHSSAEGLSRRDACQRLAETGPNVTQTVQPRSSASILASQFQSLPVAILLGAAAVSVLTGGLLEAVAILAVVGMNGAIGFKTESRAEATIRSLGAQASRTAQALRDGVSIGVPVREIVPGDVISLRRGDVVPADARVISAQGLSVSEAMLTGESMPVSKHPEPIGDWTTPLGARSNMLYCGTIITGGGGRALAVATGSSTQTALIQRLVTSTARPETPLQRQLGDLGRQLGWVTLAAGAVIAGVGLLRGQGLIPMIRSALSIAVAAMPEGLPLLATTILALGVEALRKRGVYVRRLAAIETLGAVQTICFDKTGTLTLGRINVEQIRIATESYSSSGGVLGQDGRPAELDQKPALQRLLQVGALCSDVQIVHKGTSVTLDGSPTECALVQSALDSGIDVAALRQQFPRTKVQHRSEAYRFMATTHVSAHGQMVSVKGSPDDVLERCRFQMLPDGTEQELTPERRARIEERNLELASQALRVLGMAERQLQGQDGGVQDRPVEDLTWIGLVGMADQIRPGIRELMSRLHEAGIQTIMLTGDQRPTAIAVSERIHLNGPGAIRVTDAAELEGLTPAELGEVAGHTQAFSRVSPAQKLQIVRSLQAAGTTVAMVGDGVNDGPALRAANVSIAVAETDVAAATREIADILITSDRLDGLLPALVTGRTTHRNIRKALRYLVSTNLSEVLLVLSGTAAGMSAPLSPMQLLWINLITDVLPGLGLAMEAPEADVLEQGPMEADAPVLGRDDIAGTAAQAAMLGAGALASTLVGWRRYGANAPQTGTMTFGSIMLAQLLHALTSRSEEHGIFGPTAPPRNNALSAIVGGSIGVHLIALLLPVARGLLGVSRLSARDAATTLAGGVLPFIAMELNKLNSIGPGDQFTWRRDVTAEPDAWPGDQPA
ncbi:cation-transporting P-type ATPase [Pseudaminobacter sp. 19-2017]|uniref:Cation-transporting P-type ATPase n=1 Tax=Pseudaminobacter soli (ex Zhang et al. 2022) TaxID=2831468 RepID=A0A942I4Q9_9HYPH|nr:cation-transporting P-type ATPase [Pseudaminobacter soli]